MTVFASLRAGWLRRSLPAKLLSAAVADGRTLPTDIEPAPWPCRAKVDERCRRTIRFRATQGTVILLCTSGET